MLKFRGWRAALVVVVALIPSVAQAVLVVRRLTDWLPVWAWYPDPGYQYLLAGGQIVTGGTPHHNDHPGTSTQWVVGLSEAVAHALFGNDGLRSDLVRRPEFYAQAVSFALGMMFVVALGFCALRLLRYLGLVPSLVFQLLLLWGLPILDIGRYRIMPESLVLTSAVAVIGLLAPRMAKQSGKLHLGEVIAIGVVAAVGLTSKVLFAPLILFIVLLLRRREIAIFALSAFASVVVILIPVFSRLGYMRDWFLGILVNPGRQGQTGEASNVLISMLETLTLLNLSVRWFLIVGTGTLAISFLGVLMLKKVHGRVEWRAPAGLFLAFCTVLLASIKDAEMRDFLLAIPLLAAMNAVGVYMIFRSITMKRWRSPANVTLVAVVTFLALHGIVGSEYNHRYTVARLAPTLDAQEVVKAATREGVWAFGYNAWTQENAIMFAIPWLNGAYTSEMHGTSPRATYFDVWSSALVGTSKDEGARIWTCLDMQSVATASTLGIVVETPNHLAFTPSGGRIVLRDGTAAIIEENQLGPWTAYELAAFECDVGAGNER